MGKPKAPKDPFRKGRKAIGRGVADFLDRDFENFDTIGQEGRAAFGREQGFSGSALGAIQSGGFVPLNSNQLGAIGTFQSLQGGDPAFGQALSAFGDQSGINALRGINIGRERSAALSPLRGINVGALQNRAEGALRGINVGALQSNAESAGISFVL